MYTKIEQAIIFATNAHHNQKRKNLNIDFIVHPYTVANMLISINMDEETIITGLLHDVIEDTKYTYDGIKKIFGKQIADNVLNVSEDTSIENWRERKEKFLEKINTLNNNLLCLELADKLHNLLSENINYQNHELFKNSKTTFENNKWFYTKVYEIAISKGINNLLTERYLHTLERYFNYEK